MHKIFLTEPEVSFIHGGKIIANEFGGFPSMENGRLLRIVVTLGADISFRSYNVSLLFDLQKWAAASSHYTHISNSNYRYVQLDFYCIRDIFIENPDFSCCGEFKFGVTNDRKRMYQDSAPLHPRILERPFYSFYMRSGHDFVLEFDDSRCSVFATMLEHPPL